VPRSAPTNNPARARSGSQLPYGAEDPAGFFAVTTEAFFLVPIELEEEEPRLYAVFRDYFRQDPARW